MGHVGSHYSKVIELDCILWLELLQQWGIEPLSVSFLCHLASFPGSNIQVYARSISTMINKHGSNVQRAAPPARLSTNPAALTARSVLCRDRRRLVTCAGPSWPRPPVPSALFRLDFLQADLSLGCWSCASVKRPVTSWAKARHIPVPSEQTPAKAHRKPAHDQRRDEARVWESREREWTKYISSIDDGFHIGR